MIPGNNFSEIQVLRKVEESIMDVISRARDILGREAVADELRRAAEEVNAKQAVYEDKLSDLLRLHERRHQEFQALFGRCRGLLADLEEVEDRIQAQAFNLLSRDAEDADAIVACAVGANRSLDGWLHRHLQGLKQLFSREEVRT